MNSKRAHTNCINSDFNSSRSIESNALLTLQTLKFIHFYRQQPNLYKQILCKMMSAQYCAIEIWTQIMINNNIFLQNKDIFLSQCTACTLHRVNFTLTVIPLDKQRRNLSPIWTLMITVGDRGQRDKWVNRKLNQVIILSGVRVKVGKKAVQAARQGDGQECGQEVWQRDRQEGE